MSNLLRTVEDELARAVSLSNQRDVLAHLSKATDALLQHMASVPTNSEAVSEALVALADGADKCAQAPHFIVQPFLDVYRKHGETIAAVRAKLGSRAP
jgi:hypothetical protein